MEETTFTPPEDEESDLANARWTGLPVVVIAGRPNVGKSTLFNRLLRARRAITDPTPGVTRDPIEANCFIKEGKPVLLVDTGGVGIERAGLDQIVADRSLDSFAKAELILLVLDATGLTPEDEELVGALRPLSSKVLLVVNKADNPDRERDAMGFARLGFPGIVIISAEHAMGIDELRDMVAERLDFSKVVLIPPTHEELRIAIVGKPNTGKSSLMNRLLGDERSIVSDIPGTTRDVVEGSFTYRGRPLVVLDTAGIRRKAKVTEDIEYYSVNRAVKSVEDSDVVFLMIDATEGLTDQDKKIAAIAAKTGRGLIFVLNKWDLMPKERKEIEAARDRLHFLFGQLNYAPILNISAKEGRGIDKLLDEALAMFNQLRRRIETGPLNQALKQWLQDKPPPASWAQKFKLRYMTQVGVNPVKFLIFVSKPDVVSDSYLSYIRNRIRKDLGFDTIPITIELRGSRIPFEQRER